MVQNKYMETDSFIFKNLKFKSYPKPIHKHQFDNFFFGYINFHYFYY